MNQHPMIETPSYHRPPVSHLKRTLRQARSQLLTPRQQEMMRLYYDENQTMPQIAQQLGVNASTVSRTIARAKVRLQRHLQYGYTPPEED